jgi:Predicted periplasmic lipoprotein (DUF2279)
MPLLNRQLATVCTLIMSTYPAHQARAEEPTSVPSSQVGNPVEPVVPPGSLEHRWASAGIVAGTYILLYGYTWFAWYDRTANSATLQFRDEGYFGRRTYAGGVDKLGHAWSNYTLVRGSSQILRWGGFSTTASLITGVALADAFFTLVEIKDGYKPQYGFSWQDYQFNILGEALGVLLELCPALDRRFDYRIEYFPSKYYRQEFASSGINSAEDYTGQRLLIAYHLSSIDGLRESRYTSALRFVDVAVGFHADHYKPDAPDPNPRVQEVFLGVTLNLQRVVDEFPTSEGRAGATVGTGTLHFATEVLQVPFTTLRFNIASRVTPDDVVPGATISH